MPTQLKLHVHSLFSFVILKIVPLPWPVFQYLQTLTCLSIFGLSRHNYSVSIYVSDQQIELL